MSNGGLAIPISELKDLDPLTLAAVSKLSTEDQLLFFNQWKSKRRSVGAMVTLAVLFPIQLFFLAKAGLGIAFILTGGGFLVWYVIEWFKTPKRVREYNNDKAMEVLQGLSLLRGLSND
jgi:hypothetical protein